MPMPLSFNVGPKDPTRLESCIKTDPMLGHKASYPMTKLLVKLGQTSIGGWVTALFS